jgi:hypothetical protein
MVICLEDIEAEHAKSLLLERRSFKLGTPHDNRKLYPFVLEAFHEPHNLEILYARRGLILAAMPDIFHAHACLEVEMKLASGECPLFFGKRIFPQRIGYLHPYLSNPEYYLSLHDE